MDGGGICEICGDKYSGDIEFESQTLREDTLLPRLLRSHQLEHGKPVAFRLFARLPSARVTFIGYAHANSEGISFALTRRFTHRS